MAGGKVKKVGGRFVTNVLGSGDASKPKGHNSFISYWRSCTGISSPPCFAVGCTADGRTGGHVKLADSPIGAAFKFHWWVVPACSTHNKASSCGSYRCKPGTLAVQVEPSVLDRIQSYPADGKKLVATALGKKRL